MLISVGLALLLGAWLMSTRPFGAPDEQAHYLRALTITNGSLLGPKVTNYQPFGFPTPVPASLQAQLAWMDHDVRAVYVPPGLAPPSVACLDGKPDFGPRGCVEPTPTGDYPPLAYLLPAVALGAAHDTTTADWLGRAASAIPVAALLLTAVWLAAAIGPWALLGLLVAVTPMTLFAGSILNSSGLDIAASLACAAAALRIATAPRQVSGWVWVALSVSGAVAVLSWQLGPWFVLLSLVLSAAISEPVLVWRRSRRWVLAAAATLVGAYAVSLVYGLTSGLLHGTIASNAIRSRLSDAFSQLFSGVLPGAIGNFGWLTVPLPRAADWIWWLGALALIGPALWYGGWRERAAVATSLGVALLFPVVFFAFAYSQSGFGLQARQVLPVLMLVPLLSGAVLQRSVGDRRSTRPAIVGLAAAAIGCFQLFAWWINARHSADQPGAFWFLSHPGWSPPAGWGIWTAVAVAGAAALVVSGLGYAGSGVAWRQRLSVRAGPAPR